MNVSPSAYHGALIRRAKWLAYFTIAYNLLEGFLSIGFGAKEESFALAGFGFDSLIEVASAVLVVWRLRADLDHSSPLSVQAERRTTLRIGLLFALLALVVSATAITQMVQHAHPESTIPGVLVSVVSLSLMFFLWKAKLQIVEELNSKTLAADASCSLACIKLSGVLLVGSVLFWLAPSLWWVDAVAALGIAILVAREGWESIEASRKEDFKGGCRCH